MSRSSLDSRLGRCFARRIALGEATVELVGAAAGAGRPFALDRGTGNESVERRIETEFPPRLREKMHARRPAARHEKEIAGNPLAPTDRTILADPSKIDRLDPEMPERSVDCCRRMDRNVRRPRRLHVI